MPIGFHHRGFGVGYGPGQGIFMILFLLLIVLAVVWAINAFVHRRDHARPWSDQSRERPMSHANSEAERILGERFARGEIDADDFKERRDLLRERS